MSLIFFLKPHYFEVGGGLLHGGWKKKKRKKKKPVDVFKFLPDSVLERFRKSQQKFLEDLVQKEMRALRAQQEAVAKQEAEVKLEKETEEDLATLLLMGEF